MTTKPLPAFTNAKVEIVSSKPTVSFEFEGARYHAWLNERPSGGFEVEPTIGTKRPTLYKRPPATVKKGHKDYFDCRHLDARKGRWMEIINAIATPDAIAAAWEKRRKMDGGASEAIAKNVTGRGSVGPRGPEPSRFYLVPYQDPERPLPPDVEMMAFLKTSGDTVGVVRFMYPRGLAFWRNGACIAEANTAGGYNEPGQLSDLYDLYRFAEKNGKDW